MKRSVAVFCLFVIMLQGMSTLFIFTSFYINRDYISNNVCVNRFDKIPICKGQCYLGGKLKENEKQEKKFPDLKQKEIQLYHTEQQTFNAFYKNSADINIPSRYAVALYSSSFYASVFHPPQAA